MLKRRSKRFLSIVLSAAMLLTMAPAAAFAEGESDVTSLPAEQDGVITLTGDVTLSDAYTVNEGETVTIDLAGHKITNAANKHTIINKGTLTINDSSEARTGVVDNVSHGRAAIYNDQTGDVILNGGTYDRSYEAGSATNNNGGNSYYTLKNFGKMTINAGVTVQQDGTSNSGTTGKYSSLVANGWQNIGNAGNGSEPACPNGAYAELTINGGTFKGGLNTIKNDDRGMATIKDGNFENFVQAIVQNHNILTIEGGTYTASTDDTDQTIYGVYNCGCAAENDIGTLTITGGTFSGADYAVADVSTQPAQVKISGGDFTGSNAAIGRSENSKAEIAVTGGTFSNDVSSFVAENHECVKEGDNWKVQPLEDKLVVKPSIGDDNKVSATLEGTYVDSDTDVTEPGEENTGSAVDDTGVTVDLTTDSTSNTTSAALTVTAKTAKSLAENKAPSLSVKTDVGTVALDQTAVAKMGEVTEPVVISVEKTTPEPSDTNVAAEYTVSVTSNGKALLPDGAANGTVTITVPVTEANLQPWYVVDSNSTTIYAEKLPVVASTNDSLTFTIGHLSKIQLLKKDPTNTAIASITKKDGTKTYYSEVSALQTAIASVTAGDVIDLLDDVKVGTSVSDGPSTYAINLPAAVTLNGNVHTLSYTGEASGNGINAIINANGSTINDLVINATGAKYGVHFYNTTTGTLDGVTINNGNFAAVNVNGATNVTITDSTLNPGENAYANIDYSLGNDSLTNIPSMTIENVTFKTDGDIMQVWADESTINRIKTLMGDNPTNDQVLAQVKENITYDDKDGGSLQITVDFGENAGGTVTGEVESTTQPSQGGGGIIAVPSYSVSIDAADNGSVSADRTSAMKGKTVTLTITPDEGYVLDSLTVTDKNGDAVELTKVSESEYTFTMPASKVSVAATFVKSGDEPAPTLPFVDVDPDAWYYDAVEYAYNAGLMTGTAADKFSPSLTTTRGMIVSILYRQEGEPAVTTDAGLADVVSGAYYEDAVNWAAEEGIVNGYSDTAFGPNDAITREQMAAILMNYAEYKGQDVSARADLSGYTDADTVSAWATDAVQWANAEGLINGMSDTQLAPKGSATRAQVAAILQRFLSE